MAKYKLSKEAVAKNAASVYVPGFVSRPIELIDDDKTEELVRLIPRNLHVLVLNDDLCRVSAPPNERTQDPLCLRYLDEDSDDYASNLCFGMWELASNQTTVTVYRAIDRDGAKRALSQYGTKIDVMFTSPCVPTRYKRGDADYGWFSITSHTRGLIKNIRSWSLTFPIYITSSGRDDARELIDVGASGRGYLPYDEWYEPPGKSLLAELQRLKFLPGAR